MIAWNVYLNGKWIDTIFNMEKDANEVKRSLINHDGYDWRIVVKKGDYQVELPEEVCQPVDFDYC